MLRRALYSVPAAIGLIALALMVMRRGGPYYHELPLFAMGAFFLVGALRYWRGDIVRRPVPWLPSRSSLNSSAYPWAAVLVAQGAGFLLSGLSEELADLARHETSLALALGLAAMVLIIAPIPVALVVARLHRRPA